MDIGQLRKEVVLTGCASETEFRRLPGNVIARIPRLDHLAGNTSGIRVRFETDSRTIRIVATLGEVVGYVHMPVSSSSGFDVYVNGIFLNNIRPEMNSISIDGTIEIGGENSIKLIDIYFPLYNSVSDFYFELDKGALKRIPVEDKAPVLFYGSSITQGACASRPGNSYANMVGRMVDTPIINLGFSGNARGDLEIAEYISTLDISALVYDYDHNAPDTAFLEKTHEPFFRVIRIAKPDLPVIMMSRPGYEKWSDIARCNTQVVMTTYLNALSKGDKNVYFIDGKTLFGTQNRDACSVDGTHPNDIGFLRMAEIVSAVLKEILED
ncbi:MAG: hypothetical protein JXN62_14005 [Bacteroidales bacterium]|nr:hypothetical protein [Bacteroidales bacterium]